MCEYNIYTQHFAFYSFPETKYTLFYVLSMDTWTN